MSEDERFQYLEGKIWALKALPRAVLKSSGIRNEPLEGLIEQGQECWRGLSWDTEAGEGIDQALGHLRSWRCRA